MEGEQENAPQLTLINEEESRRLNRRQLTNRLNAINFQDGTVHVTLRHRRFGHLAILTARPHPCFGLEACFSWVDPSAAGRLLASHIIQEVSVANGSSLLRMTPEVLDVGSEGFRLKLPESCNEGRNRAVRRHLATAVDAEFLQNGAVFSGMLVDFNALSFRLKLHCTPPTTFQWLNAASPGMLILSAGGIPLYTGACRMQRQGHGQQSRTFVLEPLQDQAQRFKSKAFRSERLELVPSPDASFHHPLTGRKIERKVINMSGAGFAVREHRNDAVLPVGLVIPRLEINFANTLRMACRVQVVHRHLAATRDDTVVCGLAILDMTLEDHNHLLALLHQASDSCSYFCSNIDVDALWEFFFEAGFIYPEKYAFIQGNKEKFKETYVKLYSKAPSISRHFIYQDNGRILGHMAMLRFYENSWLIQHHAANTILSKKAGLIVLSQVGRCISDSQSLYSAHMHYAMCYYRPNNKFPRRVFGGVHKYIADPKGCSLDTFAYFHYLRAFAENWPTFGSGWRLEPAGRDDLEEFDRFYEHQSGGLMIPALALDVETAFDTGLSEEFSRLGFKRERQLFALRLEGALKAVLLVNQSDMGLNLAELTNSIQVFVVDGESLSRRILYSLLSHLCASLGVDETPVLLYPVDYAEKEQVPYDKQYALWVINCQYSDAFFQFCNSFLERH
jgi:hypothetical protein